MRFLGLSLEDSVPEAKTLWLYREALANSGAVEELFDQFDRFLKDSGYLVGGQIIDATIVSAAPRQHSNRDDNDTIKAGGTPKDWKPAKKRQKDREARLTKKHGRSYFGYKNHVNIDRQHKFVRRYAVSAASVHDSQKLNDVFDASNTASDVWADSAYRSAEIEARLGERGLKSRICRKGHRCVRCRQCSMRGSMPAGPMSCLQTQTGYAYCFCKPASGQPPSAIGRNASSPFTASIYL
jgi:IS5 family transposase